MTHANAYMRIHSRIRIVVYLQEYIVNLWTQDREMSQPWSMSTFQDHINNVTGSSTAYNNMWSQMQKIIGEYLACTISCPAVYHCACSYVCMYTVQSGTDIWQNICCVIGRSHQPDMCTHVAF